MRTCASLKLGLEGFTATQDPLREGGHCRLHQRAHRKEKIGVLSTSDPKFRIRVLVCFNALGRWWGGEQFQGVWFLLLTFPPSPFLGACVMACDTLPREHGRRGDVCTHYTFVTCRVSDTLLPGWVFLAQVWAGIGFSTPPPPHRLSKQDHGYPREDCILGKTCHLSREDGTPPTTHHPAPNKAGAQAELVL